jgi:hypothetical protein
MKTAMQELIEHVESIWSNGGWEETIKEKAKELLEKEKEQIIDAYYGGVKLLSGDIESAAKHYYYQTYNQNKLFTYCQREIEGQSICDKQCEHCKEYYAPLENQNK